MAKADEDDDPAFVQTAFDDLYKGLFNATDLDNQVVARAPEFRTWSKKIDFKVRVAIYRIADSSDNKANKAN